MIRYHVREKATCSDHQPLGDMFRLLIRQTGRFLFFFFGAEEDKESRSLGVWYKIPTGNQYSVKTDVKLNNRVHEASPRLKTDDDEHARTQTHTHTHISQKQEGRQDIWDTDVTRDI